MKKQYLLKTLAALMCVSSLLMAGCGSKNDHAHEFSASVAEEQYLKSSATCSSAAIYYKSCACGEAGEETFTFGSKTSHDYTQELATEKYLKAEATCQSGAVYYKSCTYCGKRGYDFNTFTVEGFGDHAYTKEVADFQYLHAEATAEAAPSFYKTCVCGKTGTETFSYGEPLREYTAEEKAALTPSTLTMTLYDTAEAVYGFTYQTQIAPLRPVIQIAAGDVFGEAFEEYSCSVKAYTSYGKPAEEGGKDVEISFYVVKAEVPMQKLSTYTYRAYDKYAQVGTEPVTVQTKDTSSTAFSFAHVSDSQVSGTSTGTLFGNVLSKIAASDSDFVLHTGDIVQTAKYESEFTDMLGRNFQYLSKLPMMAIAGNHEGDYNGVAGTYELQKHFHYNLPAQEANWRGAYYSFTYGNAKFIMLNANDRGNSGIASAQYKWLENELKNNTATWTIVAMHQPMYSPGSWGSDASKRGVSLTLRAQMKSLFAEYGVDLVLQGHDHVVSRTYPMDANGEITTETWSKVNGVNYSVDPNGVIYAMNGCAGNQGRSPLAEAEAVYTYKMTSSACSWAEITIDGNRLTVVPKYIYGSSYKAYDGATWGIEKTLS